MKRLLSGLIAASVIFASGLAIAQTYTVDPVHSFAVFRIKHMNTSYTYGRINEPTGTVEYDAAAPEKSKFEVTLKVDNIDTGNKARDNHLKAPDLLDAKEYPTMTFKSTSVKKGEGKTLDVTGDLTIHGVTKSITVKLEHTGDGKDMKGTPIIGFETTFDIKRTDFGMNQLLQGAGDDVRIIISLEGIQK